MNSSKLLRKSVLIILVSVVVITMAFKNKPAEQNGWKDLFDGKTLKGWEVINQDLKNPDAKPDFYVENKMIICNTKLHIESEYLVTEKSYANFMIEYDVKTDTSLNSGLQCRSHVWERDTTIIQMASDNKGKTHQIKSPRKKGEVWGYQIELDPSSRAWSGGLYEQGNRGWIVSLVNNEAARKAFKLTDWNHFKVVMNGNRIQTWVNGVLAVDTTDDMSASGFIGLQIHRADKEWQKDKKTMWKNIKIMELK
jgi:hypothetical protein